MRVVFAISAAVMCGTLGLLRICFADTANKSTPTRSDAVVAGDRIVFESDAPIFTYRDSSTTSAIEVKACAPYRSQIEVSSAPAATQTDSSPDEKGVKTITTKAAPATATILRVGPRFFKHRAKVDNTVTCKDPSPKPDPSNSSKTISTPLDGYQTVQKGVTYQFNLSDLDNYSVRRYGFTYGVLVVPNKVFISNREFVSSSSVLPYVGYGAWAPGATGALILGAGVGTAPGSAQEASSPSTGGGNSSTGSSSPGTKATFSVATGMVWSFGGGTFKGGFVVGVDTAASHIGYKYQGKPWVGLSLGAGTN